MKKVLFCIFTFLFSLTVINADELVGKVEYITPDDTFKAGTIKMEPEDGTSKEVIITYNGLKLEVVEEGSPEDSSKGRPAGYSWLGVRVNVPSTTEDNLKKATFSFTNGVKQSFWENKDTNSYISLFVSMNDKKLQNAIKKGNKYIEERISFDWDNDNTIDQVILLRVNPYDVVLTDDNKLLWNSNKALAYANSLKPNDEVPKTGDGRPCLFEWIKSLFHK